MKTIGNILWLLLAGWWLALGYVIAGVVNCVFVITIPFGVQAFKLAGFALWPFGRVIVQRTDRDAALGCLANGIWFLTAGLWLAIGHAAAGVLLVLTVVGIPFGVASFRMGALALAPFGKMVVPAGQIPAGAVPVFSPPR